MDKETGLIVNNAMPEKSAPDPISLVLVAHNEAKTIESDILAFHEKVISRIPASELIVAEDGSTDGTTEIIQRLAREKGITHLTSKTRKGYIRAFLDAVASARNEYVFFADTGLKFDCEDFWKLYALRREADLIVGRRVARRDQLYRRFLTFCYNRIVSAYFCMDRIRDSDCGFRLFNKAVVEKVIKRRISFSNFVGSEIVIRSIAAGLRYREVPIRYFSREGASRGMPAGKIPGSAIGAIREMRELKKELSK